MKQKYILMALIFVLGIVFFASPVFSAGKYDYTMMERIPGFGDTKADLPALIQNLYSFALGAIGIAALFMITLGGFWYMTSAGNTARMGTAKEMISDAILGLVVVFIAYLLLYVINPDLVNVNINFKALSVDAQEAKGNAAYSGQTPGSTTLPTVSAPTPTKCSDQKVKDAFNSTGMDNCILQATAAKESSCNMAVNRTNGGRDCSMFQVNASGCSPAQSCETLESDANAAAGCAKNYLQACISSGKMRGSQSGSASQKEQWLRDLYACYNGGVGALATSNDCNGETNQYGNQYAKWDCPKNCGGYCAVPARTSTFLNYYNQCKAATS